MKKHLLYILVLFGSIGLQAQDIITYNTVQSAGTKEACKGFSLTPGFSFKAATGSSLIFRINPNVCSLAETRTSISANQNYIITLTPLGQTRSVTYDNGTIKVDRSIEGEVNVLTQIQYFDGLGRPIQTVQRGITPLKSDLVSYQEYDAFGRDDKAWLPAVIAGNNGAYASPTDVKAKAIASNGNDPNPYAYPVYEASPLNRVLKQFGPGQEWQNSTNEKPVTLNYKTNVSGDALLNCFLYKVGGTRQVPTLTKSGNYDTAQLYVTEMKDEEGYTAYEFKDKLGQVVLTRQIDNNVNHDTYYVYDDFGNRCFVLPPRINDEGITQTKLDQLAYQYKFDDRNRCIWKRLPGCEPIYYIYDRADRLICSQEGEQRAKNPQQWAFSIPDALGRIVLTGLCTHSLIYTANPLKDIVVNATYNTARTNLMNSYTITGISLSNMAILSANFYDNYDFRGIAEIPLTGTEYTAEAKYGTWYAGDYTVANKYKNKGQLTGSLTAQQLPDGTVSTTYLYSVMYYDQHARLVQAKSNNQLSGGIEKEYTAYNFTGQPTARKHIHMATGKSTQTEEYVYTYDHAGRASKVTHQLNGGQVMALQEYGYDELGRINNLKKLGNAKLLTQYGYNVRSWTKSIGSPEFNESLLYFDNGNVKQMQWWVLATQKRTYDFTYDNLSRIKTATYAGIGNEKYGTTYTYDKHGNMMTLKRDGRKDTGTTISSYGQVDNLSMTYAGNQMVSVIDGVTNFAFAESADFKDKVTPAGTIEYTYNANGAMRSDLNKGISEINYNLLNLPRQVVINNATAKAKNYYWYSASGVKLRAEQRFDPNLNITPLGTTTPANDGLSDYKITDYVGNIVYETSKYGSMVTSNTRILVDGGYYENGVYYGYVTDHLGNNRLVVKADGTVQQRNHFYPFGTAFAENSVAEQGKQPYKYNNKELDQMHGLNWYDYSARQKDDWRFTTMDPHSENYYSWSPYAYVGNNPMRLVDPTGMDWVYRVVDGKHEIYYDRGVRSQDDVNVKYGSDGGVTHLSTGATATISQNGKITSQYTFYNDPNDTNQYGNVLDQNGNLMADNQIISGNSYNIFGTTDNNVDASTLYKNMNLLGFFGNNSYTGGDNPLTYRKKYSYEFMPKNMSEYPPMGHDKDYDALGLAGLQGVFGSTLGWKADLRLAANSSTVTTLNILTGNLSDAKRSAAISVVFGAIGIAKTTLHPITIGVNNLNQQREKAALNNIQVSMPYAPF